MDAHAVDNPFASRFVRPGALPFSFAGDVTCMDYLLDRLASCEWHGAIVGPHGTGKSTLLAELAAELARRGIDVRHCVANRRGDRRPFLAAQSSPEQTTILLVDGYDRLPRWRRWLIRRRCKRNACGLVVTGHGPVGQVANLSQYGAPQVSNLSPQNARRRNTEFGRVGNPSYLGLPVLMNTATSVALAERLATALAGEAFASAARSDIRDSFTRNDGNLREVLFDLYDLYDRQLRRERNRGQTSLCSRDVSLVD